MGGLSTALALGRAGHPVTVLERDDLPPTPTAEEAFTADRRVATGASDPRVPPPGCRSRSGPDSLTSMARPCWAQGGMRLPTTGSLGEPRAG